MLTLFLAELRRLKALRTALGYAVFSFSGVEAMDIVTRLFDLPERALFVLTGVALLGLPIAMVLAGYRGRRGIRGVIQGPSPARGGTTGALREAHDPAMTSVRVRPEFGEAVAAAGL